MLSALAHVPHYALLAIPAYLPCSRARAQVTFEDYPEAGMSALKYYTIQTFTK